MTHLMLVTKTPRALQNQTPPSDEVIKDHLVWMFFYCNPNDPRGWVGKTSGLGITPNFRNIKHIYIFLSLIGLIQFVALILAAVVIFQSVAN